MPESGTIMALVGAFIAVAIMIGIGTIILGNVVPDCTVLSGNATSGWQGICETNQTSTQSAYSLLGVIMIVIAAVAILYVVRML